MAMDASGIPRPPRHLLAPERRPTVILADLLEIEEIAMRKLGEMDRASLIYDMFGFIMPNATFSMKTNDKLKS
ncbi:uncharacterized protein CLUP02_17669 [Colletotrichum lupini]|uniref:Uncharacterized protein n=1 Tax=Colletotrichum lupini TaxID=145971 RepID=A0A9Q8SFI9_9PEZI|nr:uncharacterized protein CLUP02_17669 [Colletotrichum lupini]UQC76158.1 hypothetical protein CLUP02_17669 [Colletotrichum lupini]